MKINARMAALTAALFIMSASIVSAHSTVSPSQTATSKYENFSVSVPVEKDVPTVGLRLLIPESLDRVMPVVKPGWKIAVKKDGDRVTEIEWTGGTIPSGQKDFFQFSGRTGATSTTMIWKVYQTYQGGEVVAWDQDPGAHKDHGDGEGEKVANPYSTTEVQGATHEAHSAKTSEHLPITVAIAALALSVVALINSRKTK